MTTEKFIQFGCWNNVNKGCIEQVMSTLNQYVETSPPSFIILTGDNYYPNKSTNSQMGKTKIISIQDIRKGFEMLPKSIPIYTILGNHDLETQGDNGQNMYILDNNTNNLIPEPSGACQIITSQLDIIRTMSDMTYAFFNHKILDNNTLLLMIDTSIYEVDATNYLPCYNKMFELLQQQSFENIELLRTYQLGKIMKILNENNSFNNVIIAGHHPIYQLKYKKDKVKMLTDIDMFTHVLYDIYKKFTRKPNFYYLCSDLHLYQQGTIELKFNDTEVMIINQYIVGTGGTELDPDLPEDALLTISSPNVKYSVISNKKQCGFLECTLTAQPTFKFISIPLPQEPLGGKRKKTRRQRRYKKHKPISKKNRNKKKK